MNFTVIPDPDPGSQQSAGKSPLPQNGGEAMQRVSEGTQGEGTTQNDQSFAVLQSELEQTKSKLGELTTISQRALADLQNYKKRTEEEKAQFILFANATLISQLILVLDNFERALKNVPTVEDPERSRGDQNNEWANGITVIIKQFTTILEQNGLIKIPAAISQIFDPKIHEAVMMQPGEHDQILQEVEKGYLLGERVLRRSKVIVGNGETQSPHPGLDPGSNESILK